MTEYKFSDDWFSMNTDVWRQLLGCLIDKPCHLLEIGTHEGRSALWMADNVMAHSASDLVCIDAWTGWGAKFYKRFAENLAKCERRDRIYPIRKPSHEAMSDLAVSHKHERWIDFAYIDASHDACDLVRDFSMCVHQMKIGGLICFDDYEWRDGQAWGEARAPAVGIDFILDAWCNRVTLLHKAYQVWIRVNA